MEYIDKKTFTIISLSIKGILNVARSVDNNELMKRVSDEIENILDSVECSSDNIEKKSFENTVPKDNLKQIKVSKDLSSSQVEVNPVQIVKPLD